MNDLFSELQTLAQDMHALKSGSLSVAAFSQQARAQQALLQALPEKFSVVLHGLLDRLESSALFAEESCSFSQQDLFDSLQMWLDKAKLALDRQPGA
jgi:hypothetical protein